MPRGRPTKCTPEFIEAFGETLERVVYINAASAEHGITSRSAHHWLKRGEEELHRIEQGYEPDPSEAVFVEFYTVCKEARSRAEERLLATIIDAASNDNPGDWKAAGWILERAFPFRYGRRTKVEHSGSIDQTTTFKVTVPTPRNLIDVDEGD